jgi:hypothetical protein
MIPRKSNAAAAPVAAANNSPAKGGDFQASAKGTKPSHILKFKEGKEGKYVTVTGLWESQTKAGESFLKGTDKESGVTYVIMPNTYTGPKSK